MVAFSKKKELAPWNTGITPANVRVATVLGTSRFRFRPWLVLLVLLPLSALYQYNSFQEAWATMTTSIVSSQRSNSTDSSQFGSVREEEVSHKDKDDRWLENWMLALNNNSSNNNSNRTPHHAELDEVDPCSVEYWRAELAKEEEDPLLEIIEPNDIGFIHTTFLIQGNLHAKIREKADKKTPSRDIEMQASVSSLKKALPEISYQHVHLGNYSSYQLGITALHAWAANSSSSPFSANIVIDTDLLANHQNSRDVLRPEVLTWAFHNVDLVLAYNPHLKMKPNNHAHGLQGSFIGYRSNRRTQLFHSCVAHKLYGAAKRGKKLNKGQQAAMVNVLQSDVGQFLRIRWLPPKFVCSNEDSSRFADFVIHQRFLSDVKTHCMFVHSHRVANQGWLAFVMDWLYSKVDKWLYGV